MHHDSKDLKRTVSKEESNLSGSSAARKNTLTVPNTTKAAVPNKRSIVLHKASPARHEEDL